MFEATLKNKYVHNGLFLKHFPKMRVAGAGGLSFGMLIVGLRSYNKR